MSLPFQGPDQSCSPPCRVATAEGFLSIVADATTRYRLIFPALKRRAKFMPTLRVENVHGI